MQLIGVDTGGTFTDVVVATGNGQLAVAKALSTPGRLEDGVLAALRRAAPMAGTDLAGLLAGTDVLAHGTTVGLNALLTGAGARVGLITTAGFESTLSIAKSNKIHDLPPADRQAPARWAKPDQLVDPRDIAGIAGRIDASGAVLADLDETQARAAIAGLLGRGVRSLAVCLLWSPANSVHEDRVRELATELAPGLQVTTSSGLASRIGEYERMTTAVIDAYIAPLVSSYLEQLEKQLRELGFGGAFLVVRMGGGVQPAQTARQQPVHTLRSGPAGGVAAARQLGAQAGFWGSFLPAVWNFMLALRSRGLGSAWVTMNLGRPEGEEETAKVLGIPHERYTQAGLFPIGYTMGTDFKPIRTPPVAERVHWDHW